MSRDPYRYFRVEARELTVKMGEAVLSLERGDMEAVGSLLRLAHTLKGAARVVKQTEVAELAHRLEEVLAPLRGQAGPAPREIIDDALTLLDGVGGRLAALASPETPAAPAAGAREEPRAVVANAEDLDALLVGLTEAHVHLARLRETFQDLERARRLTPSSDPGGESLARLERRGTGLVEQLDRELRLAHEAAQRLRMVPVASLFAVLARTARDVAMTLDRMVTFEGRGDPVQVDADVLALLQGALIQVVRNAVAHGIEPEAARRAAGKPPEGQVTLVVERRGSRIALTCTDDGRGLDLAAVRAQALRRGLPPDQVHAMGPDAVLALLLRGGISTAEAVTGVAGRGIGMDVVRDAAVRLGAEVVVRSRPGAGTALELLLPASRACSDVLVVGSGDSTVAVPLDAVVRTALIPTAAIARSPGGDTLLHDGQSVPFVHMSVLLGTGDPVARTTPALVVRTGDRVVAISVDRIVGIRSVVSQPLPAPVVSSPVVAGVSIDPTGTPQLVLDPQGLVAEASRSRGAAAPPPLQRPKVLVIDDSLTTRMLEQSILESGGYAVDLATSGEEGLAMARRKGYSLFLVDVEMPGMDGFTFVEQTRADAALRHVPAILVTSRGSQEDRRRGASAGAAAYIVKSEFDQAELLGRIGRLLTHV
ncbi:MAG: hypothetical protein AMXMBFR64_29930 [Myxococcales bacterium]